MAKKSSLSGFPEWLPEQQIIETAILAQLRETFSLYGYCEISSRAVEPIEHLLAKGETSKEIYLLRRLQAEEGERSSREMGLHFDLTVPLARYVVENAGRLDFPFKRFQMQKVWRGERPQEGRFREFMQADIDVVGQETLPFHYEVELPLVMAEALSKLPIGPVRILVNNRKIAQGAYEAAGIEDIAGTLRTIDKLDKIGPDKVRALLIEEIGLAEKQADIALALAEISGDDASVAERVRALGLSSEMLDEGLDELTALLSAAGEVSPGVVVADMRIARGLDYYTGSVYETVLVGHEDLGSICSGGRYDSLASDGKRTYPGVGMSIGVTRLLSRIFAQGTVRASRKVPSAVLVAVVNEDERAASDAVARVLRGRGIACETAPSAAKFGKQIKYADKRGIPYVWFPQSGEVKDIRSGEQVAADPASWVLPDEDARPSVRIEERDE